VSAPRRSVGFNFLDEPELPGPQVTEAQAEHILAQHYGMAARAKLLGSNQDCNFIVYGANDDVLGVLKIANPAFNATELEAQDAAADLIAEAEPSLSSAYAPVLATLLQTLAERTSPDELDELLREVGRRLGPASPKSGSLDTRVRAAAALLSSLGSEIDVERTPDGFLLRGHACPLAAVTRDDPHACHTVEEIVEAVVGVPVRECCDRTAGARCRFQILRPSA